MDTRAAALTNLFRALAALPPLQRDPDALDAALHTVDTLVLEVKARFLES